MTSDAMLRQYVYPDGRRVHLRRAGEGSPLVMCHPSPGSSLMLEPLIERLAEHHAVIALDTPGYGESEPLPTPDPGIGDYSRALSGTLDALGLGEVELYGSHTGAKICLQLAVDQPQRVKSLVLDGIGLYTGRERRELSANYTPPLEPDQHGAHLLRAWAMRRDMYLFWPWYLHTREGRQRSAPPPPEILHDHVVDFLRAIPGYGKGYQAAFRHDTAAALAALEVPTLLLAAPDDPLHEHLQRAGVLPDAVTLEVPDRTEAPVAAVAQRMTAFLQPGPNSAPTIEHPRAVEGAERRTYARTSVGQVLGRRWAGPGRPVVLFHPSPTSGVAVKPLAERIAATRAVTVFDTPGNGDSAPLPAPPAIGDLARVLGEAFDDLGLRDVDLYGSHTGALIAAELAITRPELVHRVVLDGVTLYDEEQRQRQLDHYAPPLQIDPHGAHLVWAWNYLRDMALFWPWYEQRPDRARLDTEPPPPAELHQRVVELLKGGRTFHQQYRAAFSYLTRDRLPLLRVPALLGAGPTDPLADATRAAAGLVAGAEFSPFPAELLDKAQTLLRFWEG